ncbi:MAG: hypothetical protein F7C36_01605 [Desulfurococcales archaeon]|nr:hypothetical protein [Desulfurococcales archaeon]
MARESALIILSIVISLIVILSGFYIYTSYNSKLSLEPDAFKGQVCGEYDYLVNLTSVTLQYETRLNMYWNNGTSAQSLTGPVAVAVLKADCVNGTLYYLFSSANGMYVYPAYIEGNAYNFSVILPSNVLVQDNRSRASTQYGSWLAINITRESQQLVGNPATAVYVLEKYEGKYDPATGILLESDTYYKKVYGQESYPDVAVYNYKISKINIDAGEKIVSYPENLRYSISLTYITGILVAAGIIGLLYAVGLMIGKYI